MQAKNKNIYSIELEKDVLGTLMITPKAYDYVIDKITTEDFYNHENQIIFDAINKLMSTIGTINVMLVFEEIKKDARSFSISEVDLFEMAKNSCGTAGQAKFHAQKIRDYSIARKLMLACKEISALVNSYDYDGSSELLEKAESKILSVSNQNKSDSSAVRIDKILAETMARLIEMENNPDEMTGLSTGFRALDKITAGFQKSDLILLAARPSMGKTALAMNIAEHAMMQNKSVLVFSMEMSQQQLSNRLISSAGNLDQSVMRTARHGNDSWDKITTANEKMTGKKLYINDAGALSPVELRMHARRVSREAGGLDLIIIDYLQLMNVPGKKDNRVLEVSEISRSLKMLAKELNVPVVALSQLNRNLEQRIDKRPIMADLRDSGGLEQDADVIMFIYRDEVYDSMTQDIGAAEIIIAKQRNGATGKLILDFSGRHTKFSDYGSSTREYVVI